MITDFDHIVSDLSAFCPQDEARELAFWILEESTGLSRTQLLTGGKITKNIPHYKVILQRIEKKEPIQYIFQHTQWCGLDLKVTPATLIPRPETAELVSILLSHFSFLHAPFSILDVGTGSGCIAIAIKQAHPEWDVWGMDISADALAVAQENAHRNHTDIHFIQGDVFSDEIRNFDLIVSNPPYVCESEKKDMLPNVLDYEPHTALFVPDDDPLRFYRRIAQIHRAPALAFEINRAMGAALCDLMAQNGYTDTQLIRDTYGNDRILIARTDC